MRGYLQEIQVASLWFLRSLKKGDWLWLMLAVIIASTTVTVVKQLGETVQQSMLRKASESLGADFVIRSSRPIEDKWQNLAEELGLKTARVTSVVTMSLTTDETGESHFQLVRLNGITDTQPLRGQWQPAKNSPSFTELNQNSLWVEPDLLSLLPLTTSSSITLGTKSFLLAGAIETPSIVNPMSNLAPQMWIKLSELEKIGLTGLGSRVTYQLQVAGQTSAIKKFSNQIDQNKAPAWQILSAEAPNADLGNSLDTAWLFLDLSALSAVLVAGMSILIASRFYLAKWKQSIALMRAYGANQRKMYRLFAFQMTWIAALSSLIGVLLGYLLSLALIPILRDYFDPLIVANPTAAILIGFFSGILVLWSFAWQAFHSAVKTSPMLTLKTIQTQQQNRHWMISFLLLIGLISLMLNVHNLHWIIAGIVVASLILYLVSTLLLTFLRAIQKNTQGWLRIAIANITREPGLIQIQLVSIGMVLFVLILMTFVRQDLIKNWQASLPADTPNAFAINIQTEQKPDVDQILSAVQQKQDAAMVRGRLTQINGNKINAEAFVKERAKRLLRRESNIAVMSQLPKYNQVIAELPANQITHPKVSIEKDIAELFQLKLGDLLTFNISGQTLEYQLASIRDVKWQSFRLNFFFIIEPIAEVTLPISYLSNFILPVASTDENEKNATSSVSKLTAELHQQATGVLLIDIRKIMAQIQEIMSQASWAVSALYGFTLLASVLVLFSATLASQQARIQSWLLLRTMGATDSTIFKIGLTEFVLLGGLAGIFAAVLAQISSLLISHYLLKIDPQLDPFIWISSVLVGSLFFLLIGLVTQWSYLKKSPQQLKRYLA